MNQREEPDEELTPDEEAEYAELLAAYLPPDETAPDEVTDRLESRLAELVVERQREVPSSLRPGLAPHAAATRRRRFGAALLAAAAVTVGGFAVTTALTGQGGDDGSADSAVSADAGGQAEGAPEDGPAQAAPVPATLPRVRADHVEDDVRLLVDDGPRRQSGGLTADRQEADELTSSKDLPLDRDRRECLVPDLEEGETWLLVRYAGDPVVLVAQPGDAPPPRTARLLPCEGGAPILEVELTR